MKIIQEETLIAVGEYAQAVEWKRTRKKLLEAIQRVDWPVGSGRFLIFPESGKKRRMGNGVTPIKRGLMQELKSQGWKLEESLGVSGTGPIDAMLQTAKGPVALEWETGNVSSSHRALNKMALGLMKRVLAAGILVVPSASLARFLTDRIGNFPELTPYLDLWRSLPIQTGILEIVVIEHDATSTDVPKIPKGKEGRAIE